MSALLRHHVTLLAALLALGGATPALAQHETWPGEEPGTWAEDPNAVFDEAEVAEEATVGQDQWDDPEAIDMPDEWDTEQDDGWDPERRREQNPAPSLPPLVKGKMVKGTAARMRTGGKAAIPRGAPQRVRKLIRALNEIVGKPYKWGGGHGRLVDSGYDCSGAVGYGLIRIGLQRGPMVSGQMARSWSGGKGRWVTVYAHSGHVYMEVAGLRLDTSPVGDSTRRMGVRWRPAIGRRGGFAARHPAGL